MTKGSAKAEATCEVCSTRFTFYPSQGKGRFCSLACRSQVQTKRQVTSCETCGTEFTYLPSQSKGRFCSGQCRQTGMNKRATSECAECGEKFVYLPGQRSGTYCSAACRDTHKAKSSEPRNRKCPCGQPVFRPGENTASARKYCSAECRSKYGKPSKVKDPSKWVTFPCQTCGKTVDRRKSVPGPRKFCSNECAAKHTKAVRHYMARDSDVVLDSTWEMLVYGLFSFHKIDIERFDRAEAIEWEPGHWYGPDFILSRLGVAIEVKGVEDPDDRRKWAIFTERTRIPIVVLDKDTIESMIGSRADLLALVVSPR